MQFTVMNLAAAAAAAVFLLALLSLTRVSVALVSPLQLFRDPLSRCYLPLPPVENIFILAGQSNMAGRGGVVGRGVWDGVVPPQCQPNPTSLVLRLAADLAWEEAREPLHVDIDANKTCGVGPGMAFANAVLDGDPGFGVVGLVPCAVGGTKITEWGRGGRLYSALVRRAGAARELGGGAIRAVLWYQGETDTVSREDAELYKQRMERLILDLRADLHSPNLPVFQVALASGEGTFVENVREAQQQIDLPNVVTVDAKGLNLKPDCLHLTTEAEVRVGEMLADAFLRSLSSSSNNRHSPAAAAAAAEWSAIMQPCLVFVAFVLLVLCRATGMSAQLQSYSKAFFA